MFFKYTHSPPNNISYKTFLNLDWSGPNGDLPSIKSDVSSTYSYPESNLKNVWQGMGSLKKWDELPELLRKDKRRIKKLDVPGFGLVESVSEALAADYDIHVSPAQMIEEISKELTEHLEYTRYMKSPISKQSVTYDAMAMQNKKEYGKAVCDLFLPAICAVYDTGIRVVKKVKDYFAVLHVYPLDFHQKTESSQTKRINLLYNDFKYSPIIWDLSWDSIIDSPPSVGVLDTETSGSSANETSASSAMETSAMETSGTSGSTVNLVISPEEQGNESDPIVIQDSQEDNSDLPTIKLSESSSLKKLSFDMTPFRGMIPDVVDKCPGNIDGLRYYICDVPADDTFFQKYWDHRYFKMNTSSRKGFNGVRRVGVCRGNYICNNSMCGFLEENRKQNEVQFKTVGKRKFCSVCDCLVARKPCGAQKMIEFHFGARLLEIYHQGKHTCTPSAPRDVDDAFIKEKLTKHGLTTTPKELAQLEMTEELNKQLQSGVTDMAAIINIAAKLTDRKRINNIKAKLQTTVKSAKHSLGAVADLKSVTDTTDPYFIYKINDANMTGTGDSYVFKSSRKMANFAINMDRDCPVENVLKHEPCYFDGMHQRCQGWKTLTLWVYHKNPCRLYRLATMEVKGETSKSVAKFWEIWNELLASVKGEPGYKFNPTQFVTDEAGANFNGLKAVYGEQVLNRVITCQFHFIQCLNRLLLKFPQELPELKSEFEELMLQLLTCTTLQEYNDIKERLLGISALVPQVQGGLDWWLARRFHLFPIFRGFCLTSMNLAEVGHSTLKKKKPLTLVDAAWEDICTIILQEQEHTAFLQGKCRTGKGPSQADLANKSKKDQLKRSKDYQMAFRMGHFEIGETSGTFVPSKRARHRPNENLGVPSIEGQVADAEDSPDVIPPTQHTPSPHKRQFSSGENPPLLCLWSPMTKKCFGCKSVLFKTRPNPPDDILLKMLVSNCMSILNNKIFSSLSYCSHWNLSIILPFQVVRDRPTKEGWVKGWKKSWGYFHLNLNCIRMERSFLEVEDIYLPNDTRDSMQPQHLRKLQKMGWWDSLQKRT